MTSTRSSQQNDLIVAATRVSDALRKLATALSPNFGSDCYLHMELGQVLLGDLRIQTRRVLGFASWRVGPGVGDVLSYLPPQNGLVSPKGDGVAYHAWLESDAMIIDFTTYQLRYRAKQLDATDGQCTRVEWCPGLLLLPTAQVRHYFEVQQATRPGLAYYEACPALDEIVSVGEPPDPEGVRVARWLMEDPNRSVVGPRGRIRA